MPKSDLSDEERSAARDFVMARLAAARGQVARAADEIDIAMQLFVDVDDDTSGKDRATAIENADSCVADAARALQLAGGEMANIDPREPEPEDEDEEPAPRGKRR